MKLSQATIAAVQSSIDIEEVVADFITLKKKGKDLWACCPFHHEKTPSFSVSPAKGFYKCFGCGAAGDAITFLQEIESISFVEAIEYLAKKYGIPIQEAAFDEQYTQQQHEKDSLYILLDLAKQYYVDTLWKTQVGNNIGLSYCKERDVTAPFIKKFELGYSLDTWDGFYQFSKKKGYEDALLTKAGLIIQKADKTYDRFRGRLIFPIHNVAGKVIAFGARTLTAQNSQPKYINSPETPIYQKSQIVYGLHQAKQKMKQTGTCYLVEGYTDVIALHRVGIENVVASAGTSLTQDQIRLIGRFAQNVTLLFDSDPAGLQAALRGIDLILEAGLDVKIVLLPLQQDPDSYAAQVGADAFQNYLQAHTQDFVTFKADLLVKEAKQDPLKKAAAVKDIVQTIAMIPDAVKRALFTKTCSQLFDIAENVLIEEQNRQVAQKNTAVQKRQALNQKSLIATSRTSPARTKKLKLSDTIAAYEKEVVRMLLHYGTMPIQDNIPLYEYLLCELQDVTFHTPACKAIFEQFKNRHKQKKATDADYFIRHGEETIKKFVIDLMAAPYAISDQWQERYQIYVTKEEDNVQQAAFENILRLKLRLIQQLIQENTQAFKKANEGEEDHFLKVHEVLKKSEMEIAQQLGMVITQ